MINQFDDLVVFIKLEITWKVSDETRLLPLIAKS